MIGDGRAPEAPPCDSLAEALVIQHIVFLRPWLIDQLDLAPLLVMPEHRTLWRVAVRTRMRHPDLNDAHFYLKWLSELWRTEPRADLYLDTLDQAFANQSHRQDEEWERGKADNPARSHYYHGFDYWLGRLQQITQARRGISAAQRIAERFWDVPDHPFTGVEAMTILEKAVPPQRSTLADRVLNV